MEKSSGALRRATGRDYAEWFAALDRWGAKKRDFREIRDWLVTRHGFSNWWAQKVVVEYQQLRGTRAPGSRADGTFTVTASKTIGAPSSAVVKVFTDQRVRTRWLPDAGTPTRTSAASGTSFDWPDGSRVRVTFLDQGGKKTQVAVEHSKLPDARAADERKAYWRERLSALKALLETAARSK